MTVTAQTLVYSTRLHLLGNRREPLNRLAADTVPGAVSLELEFPPGGVQEGSTVQIGLELFYVWSVSGQTATVQPGYDNSVETAHDQGDLVTVNPKYPDHRILQALNDDLLDLSAPGGLYRTRTVDLTWVDTAGGYDLTGVTDLLDLNDVWAQRAGVTSKDWVPVSNYRLERNADTGVFPSGFAVYFDSINEPGAVLRLRYRSGFSPLVNLTDDAAAVTGLPLTALDIPPLGAAARLLRDQEVVRNSIDSQGDTRRAEEVPAGAVRRSADGLWADRARRIRNETARLGQANPLISPIPSAGVTVGSYAAVRY